MLPIFIPKLDNWYALIELLQNWFYLIIYFLGLVYLFQCIVQAKKIIKSGQSSFVTQTVILILQFQNLVIQNDRLWELLVVLGSESHIVFQSYHLLKVHIWSPIINLQCPCSHLLIFIILFENVGICQESTDISESIFILESFIIDGINLLQNYFRILRGKISLSFLKAFRSQVYLQFPLFQQIILRLRFFPSVLHLLHELDAAAFLLLLRLYGFILIFICGVVRLFFVSSPFLGFRVMILVDMDCFVFIVISRIFVFVFICLYRIYLCRFFYFQTWICISFEFMVAYKELIGGWILTLDLLPFFCQARVLICLFFKSLQNWLVFTIRKVKSFCMIALTLNYQFLFYQGNILVFRLTASKIFVRMSLFLILFLLLEFFFFQGILFMINLVAIFIAGRFWVRRKLLFTNFLIQGIKIKLKYGWLSRANILFICGRNTP